MLRKLATWINCPSTCILMLLIFIFADWSNWNKYETSEITKVCLMFSFSSWKNILFIFNYNYIASIINQSFIIHLWMHQLWKGPWILIHLTATKNMYLTFLFRYFVIPPKTVPYKMHMLAYCMTLLNRYFYFKDDMDWTGY